MRYSSSATLALAATAALGLVHSFMPPAPQQHPRLLHHQRWMTMTTSSEMQTAGKMDLNTVSTLPSKVKSVLYLATDKGEDMTVQPDGVNAFKKQGLDVHHVPIPPKSPSLELADQCLRALDKMQGPTMVVCASGARASAVKTMKAAMEKNMTPDQTLEYAQANNMPFLKNPTLKDWVLGVVSRKQFPEPMIFRPLFEESTWTFSFILACPETKEAVIIDPVDVTAERDVKVAQEMGVNLKYAINTHCHADHITGSGLLSRMVPGCKSTIAEASGAVAGVKVKDGDRIKFGNRYIECRSTPGHTDGCMTFLTDDYRWVFTGDAVLIRGCGRTDFQQGDPVKLWNSIHNKIFCLPTETIIYPGHDYKGLMFTTVGEEQKYNARIAGKTQEQFVEIMNNLNLPYPKKIDASLPSNKVDGLLNR